MSGLLLLDTSVFVDYLRSGEHEARMASLTGLIRTSAVVLAELWRGAIAPAEQRFLSKLRKNHPVLTPTESNWLESGELLGRMRADHGLTRDRLRALHFDILIALTARSHGARLITSNRRDFEMIRSYREFDLEAW